MSAILGHLGGPTTPPVHFATKTKVVFVVDPDQALDGGEGGSGALKKGAFLIQEVSAPSFQNQISNGRWTEPPPGRGGWEAPCGGVRRASAPHRRNPNSNPEKNPTKN